MIVRQNLPMAVRVNVVPMRRRKGIGDAVSDAAAAADAARGGAGYPVEAGPSWAGDASWRTDPTSPMFLIWPGAVVPVTGRTNPYWETGDGWANAINFAPSAAAALAGRTAPNSSQLGITKEELNCTLDMQLTADVYWAAFKSYNAGTWTPPGAVCGPSNPQYGPTSSLLYPNVYISPTWSGNAAPAGVTDATVQAQYAATQAAATQAATAQAAATGGSQTATGTGVQYTASPSPTSVTTTTGSWFTDQMISGVPNWALLAAAAVVAVLAFGGKR
jgi:hypothetical protein